MKSVRAAVATMGLVALIALPASAQGPRFGGGMFGGPAGLLSNKGVQKELKLDDDQATKVNKLAEDMRAKQREAMESARDLAPEERRTKMMELSRTMNADADKALADILKPEQLTRFKQIRLQTRGADAFNDPAVQAELKLTDEQKSKVRELMDNQMSQMREIFQNAGDDRDAARQKMMALRKQTNEKAVAVLTDDQKKAWTGMVGDPYDFRPEPPPGR